MPILKTIPAVTTIGDPHLGRKFATGVPLVRLGEREERQYQDFEEQLNEARTSIIVIMGDLFDSEKVDNADINRTYQILKEWSEGFPDKHCYLLSGNHDMNKDKSKVSSFHLLSLMFNESDNVHFVTDTLIVSLGYPRSIALIGWNAFKTAKEQVESLYGHPVEAIFAHWEISRLGGRHAVPIDAVAEITDYVVTGHEHTPEVKEFKASNGKTIRVEMVGSMQPYAHGEVHQELSPHSPQYLTHTLAQVKENLEITPDYYENTCLRILVEQGERIEISPNCLALTQVTRSPQDETINTEINLELNTGFFSLQQQVIDHLARHEVSPSLSNTLVDIIFKGDNHV